MAKNPNTPQTGNEKNERPAFLKSRILMNRLILGLALAAGGAVVWYGSQPNTSKYEMSVEEKEINDKMHSDPSIIPPHFVKIGLNRLDPDIIPAGTNPNVKTVRLALPGKDWYGDPQNPPFLEPEAKRFWKIYKHCLRTR
ncbi:hypothetical protein KAR91_34380, partial [Candidatus Pacearchaeota archaeon]|nr:hypothetical protein [Candidatus Pacearchaeota archaeon]